MQTQKSTDEPVTAVGARQLNSQIIFTDPARRCGLATDRGITDGLVSSADVMWRQQRIIKRDMASFSPQVRDAYDEKG